MDDMETQVATKVATKTKIAIIALMIASIAAAGFIGYGAYKDRQDVRTDGIPAVDEGAAETMRHECQGSASECEGMDKTTCGYMIDCEWVHVQD